MITIYNVAVWYLDHNDRTDYDLFPDEADAALFAAGHEAEWGFRAVLGVQFADGTLKPAAEWPALDEGRRRHREYRAANLARPLPETHTIRDPFTFAEVEVEDGEPDWLGAIR